MENKNEILYKSAIKPTRIAVIIYVIVKQILYMLSVEGNNWIVRFAVSVVWVAVIFAATGSKKLTQRQMALVVLLSSALSELVFYSAVGGDRLIYFYLIGCSLLSVLFVDTKSMLISMVFSCAAVAFCVFGLDINTVGIDYIFMDDICNLAGVVLLNIVIFLIGKYSIGTLAEARQAAEVASRAKSAFLATMSHEIRTPLNAIIGIAQIQLQKDDLPKEYHDEMERIYSSGNSLLGIINDLLDMSKIETGKLELNPGGYDVPGFINDAVQLNIVRIGSKPIEFILDIDETLPKTLYGDELRLKQILNNLLSNAIKYTEKGRVKLSVSHSAHIGSDTVLRFVVEDTGQGMKPEDLKELFLEYSRFNAEANRATEGTGLGLSITKCLVEMMDGTIDVQSEYGKGSVFTVTVRQKAVHYTPIGAELAQKLQSFSFTGERQTAGLQISRTIMPYGKVLVVDDMSTNLYVAKGLLAQYQLAVDIAESGFEALEKTNNGEVYDIIFMDHMMPRMDGIETTQKLRESGYTGTIVALTANALAGNESLFEQNGFDGFISKPMDVKKLDTVLNKFIRDRHD